MICWLTDVKKLPNNIVNICRTPQLNYGRFLVYSPAIGNDVIGKRLAINIATHIYIYARTCT